MSVVTRTPVRSRLSRMVDSAGGLSVRAALEDARKRLAAMEPRSREIIAGLIAELSALPVPAGPEELRSRGEEAYRISSAVLDAAGLFDHPNLCAAATSLCNLIDQADGRLDWRVVPVHARAMELMLTSKREDHAQRARILEGLADIRDRKASQGD